MQHVALVTGGSGGIGYELARLFAKDGRDVVVVSRDAAKLGQVCTELEGEFKIKASAIPVDLSVDGAARELAERLKREGTEVEFLVNNAGFGTFGDFVETSIEDLLGQISLNITALTDLTRRLLPAMLERGAGKVLNVASTAGFQAGPRMAVYYATKAYVISLSEALSNELQGSGVTVTCLCPGATDTGFQKRAHTENSILFRKLRPMSASEVAGDGYKAMMAGKSLAISGLRNWLVAESVRFAPRRLVTAISRKILDEVDS
jgi:short-subunit dehydrogenase